MFRMNMMDVVGLLSGAFIIIGWGVFDYITTKKKNNK
jgi:hypothetical protein